jgi:YHS domain-containing protein
MWLQVAVGVALGYIGYRIYRRIREMLPPGTGRDSRPLGEPETLVQDPVCGTYIPRRNALKTVRDGQEYFFCSEGCFMHFRRQGKAG